ncbi:MAG TPA: divalent-cation tolerance protein CutA [Blastocatellia bacterium]|nr:divalent-cation tolerance protein CutA [Blastocatellia bacterium]
MAEEIVVLVTINELEEARKLAEELVQNRLIACANIISGVDTIYRWKDEIQRDREVMIILKTTRELFAKVEEVVKELHSYELPEVIALPIAEGSEEYLQWLRSSLSKETP